ncbi:MAG: hypothetical protein U0792_20645 [Gemmataceae bacterium]
MNTPDNLPTNEFPEELLAGFADSELDAQAAAAVDRWLAEHPESLASLNAQREFGPANAALWEQAEIPEPSPAAWKSVRQNIEAALNKPVPRSPERTRLAVWLLTGMASAAIAASVAWFAFVTSTHPAAVSPSPEQTASVPEPKVEVAPAPRTVTKPDLLAEFAVLDMASDDDVILERVPDTRNGWLPIGRHPLPETLALATIDEVNLPEVDLSPIWPLSVPTVATPPGHSPMIFAAVRK